MTAPERSVRMWLVRQGLRFRTEVPAGPFRADFVVGRTLVEVHGCHWHGCSCRGGAQTKAQRARRRRDRALAAYCRREGKRLLVIWEHEVKAGDFSALSSLTRRQ